MTKAKLIAELNEKLTDYPGVVNGWTQPIINRINMLSTGVRTDVGVKVYGSDLKVLEDRARAVAEVLRAIPGAADVYPEQVTGAPLSRHPCEARGRGASRHHARRHPGRHRDGHRRDQPHPYHRGPPALSRPRPLRARRIAAVPRRWAASPCRRPAAPRCRSAEVADIRQVSGPAMIAQRERPPGRLRAPERPWPRRRQLRRGGASRARRAGDRCRRAITSNGAASTRIRPRKAEIADRHTRRRSVDHLCAPLHDLQLGKRSAARPARSAVRTHGRRVSAGSFLGITFQSRSGSASSPCSVLRSKPAVVMVIYLEEAVRRKIAETKGDLSRRRRCAKRSWKELFCGFVRRS